MLRKQLAINLVSTGGASLEERLDAYAGAGFTNIEFALGQVNEYLAQGHSHEDARRLLDERHLSCIGGFEIALQAWSSPHEQEENLRQLLGNARLLQALGGANMVIGTDGPTGATDDALEVLARRVGEVARLVQPTGVSLLIEFNWSPLVKSLRAAAEVARRSGAGNAGVLFDPAHYHCTPTKLSELNAQNIAWIKHVHVDDMQDKPGELSNCNSDRALPGEGCLDLAALFNRIEEGGYNGFFSIEMFNDELWAMPAAQAAQRMYNSLLPLCEDA